MSIWCHAELGVNVRYQIGRRFAMERGVGKVRDPCIHLRRFTPHSNAFLGLTQGSK